VNIFLEAMFFKSFVALWARTKNRLPQNITVPKAFRSAWLEFAFLYFFTWTSIDFGLRLHKVNRPKA